MKVIILILMLMMISGTSQALTENPWQKYNNSYVVLSKFCNESYIGWIDEVNNETIRMGKMEFGRYAISSIRELNRR
jgi:hypothetical protein